MSRWWAMDRARQLHVPLSEYIPLNAAAVQRIARAVAAAHVRSHLWCVVGRNIAGDANAAFEASVRRRYLATIAD